ncbi:hypothetical protein NLI96_g4273 [Meripilus lineatus]|uniref:Uncharacterized protein n=1 Tax=Meripilus lineatus TaxID=2056292 RepID=A0AAD5V573_9APHY|nr:hypothetical protein NLI96_g4273 [Physisporinus lineatus]
MSSLMGSGFLNKIRKPDRIIAKSKPDVPPPNLFMGEPILPLSQICRKKARTKGSGKTFRKWLAKKFETRPSKKDELILHLREVLSASKAHCLVLDNRINQLQRSVTSRSRVLRETQRELSATKAEMKKCRAELAQVLVALTAEQSAHREAKEMAEAEASRLQASADLLRSEYLTTSADLKRTQMELIKTRQDAVDLQKEVNLGLAAMEVERARNEELRGDQEETEKECARLQDDLVAANDKVHAAQQELSLEKESKGRLETSLGVVQEENARLKEQLREMSTALTKSQADVDAMRDDAAQANATLVEVNGQLISTQDELAMTMGELEDVEGKLAIAEGEVEARDAEILQWKEVYDDYNHRTADGFKEKDKAIVRLRKQLVRAAGKNERLQVELERSEHKLGESNRKLEYTIISLRKLTADVSAKDVTIEKGQKQLIATQKELEETKKKLGHTISGIRNLNITLGDTKKRLHDTEREFHDHKVETSRALASLHHDAEELKVQLRSTQDDLVASEDQAALLTAQLTQARDDAASQYLANETALADARAHLTLAQNDLAVSKEKVDHLSLQLSEKATALEVADAKLSDAITRADIFEAQLDQVVEQNTLTVEDFSFKNKQLESIVDSLRSDLASVSDKLESERSVRCTLEGKMTEMIEMMNSDMEQIERSKKVIEEQLMAKVIRCKELELENLSLTNASTLSFSGFPSPTPLATVTNMTPPARAAQQKAKGNRWFTRGTFSPLGSSSRGSSSSPSEATDSQFHTE